MRAFTLAALCVGTIGLSACASGGAIDATAGDADKVLLDRGTESLNARKWATARQYFSKLLEGYPQSQLRADAKLGVGDSYLGENNPSSYVFALNEYREFLAFYPTNPRADYAQFQLGMVHINQMLGAQRDQTETKEAILELQTFLTRYPSSPMLPQAKQRLREAKDRLGDGELEVGIFYLRFGLYPSAESRFRGLLDSDPEYTGRDSLYFHLAETLDKAEKKVEALPYYERLVTEFEQSEYLADAKRRIELLKSSTLR